MPSVRAISIALRTTSVQTRCRVEIFSNGCRRHECGPTDNVSITDASQDDGDAAPQRRGGTDCPAGEVSAGACVGEDATAPWVTSASRRAVAIGDALIGRTPTNPVRILQLWTSHGSGKRLPATATPRWWRCAPPPIPPDPSCMSGKRVVPWAKSAPARR